MKNSFYQTLNTVLEHFSKKQQPFYLDESEDCFALRIDYNDFMIAVDYALEKGLLQREPDNTITVKLSLTPKAFEIIHRGGSFEGY